MIALDLFELGFNKLSFYLGLENYFLNNPLDDDLFFLWRIDKSIIIGRNQLLYNEVNLDYCNEINFQIFRRPSGGGAIYADSGTFMFSFITKEYNHNIIYKKYLNIIIKSLQKLNINCYFSGRNDLLFQGKKFSGNAIYHQNSLAVIHGTFLYNSNLENLIECLTPTNEKLISNGVESLKERVINLKDFLNLTVEEVMRFLIEDIGDKIIKLDNDIFNEAKYLQTKFESDDWIYNKNPKFTFKNKKKFNFGIMEIYLSISKNVITEFLIYGDFFTLKEISFFTNSFKGINFNIESIRKHLKKYKIDDYIYNSSDDSLLELINFL